METAGNWWEWVHDLPAYAKLAKLSIIVILYDEKGTKLPLTVTTNELDIRDRWLISIFPGPAESLLISTYDSTVKMDSWWYGQVFWSKHYRQCCIQQTLCSVCSGQQDQLMSENSNHRDWDWWEAHCQHSVTWKSQHQFRHSTALIHVVKSQMINASGGQLW